jgi:cyclic pyranopterin phosphate synthase
MSSPTPVWTVRTGGEPLLRRDLPLLVERLAARPAIQDLAMTTNGVLLARHVVALKRSACSASR